MNFNYRDFFIHNDDLHIIKEQLSIVDEMSPSGRPHGLVSNAKAVWDAYQTGKNEQTIADTLKINVETVEKIITICLMKATDDKITSHLIAKELDINEPMVFNVLTNAIGSDFKRQIDTHFINDAVKIYNLHKIGKHPEEIVVLVNNEKKEYYEKIDLNKVNIVLKIVDMAKKQMTEKGEVNIQEIYREIVYKVTGPTIAELIKKLNLGKPRYTHKFTEEQDAFVLYNYLQRTPIIKIAELFNKEFSTESNQLDIKNDSISKHIKTILKSDNESVISQKVDELLKKYFPTVNIQNPYTKDLLTHYTPPKTVGGRDRTGTGTNRDMSAHLGTLPKNFNTMITNLRNAHTIR